MTVLRPILVNFLAIIWISFETIKIQTCLAPQNDLLNLSFVKDIHVVVEKRPEMVLKRPFIILKFW